jgi:hypothetical protein
MTLCQFDVRVDAIFKTLHHCSYCKMTAACSRDNSATTYLRSVSVTVHRGALCDAISKLCLLCRYTQFRLARTAICATKASQPLQLHRILTWLAVHNIYYSVSQRLLQHVRCTNAVTELHAGMTATGTPGAELTLDCDLLSKGMHRERNHLCRKESQYSWALHPNTSACCSAIISAIAYMHKSSNQCCQ